MMGCDEVVEWLTDGARPALDTREVAAELCDRLLGCGIPVWRFGLFVLTLHPQITGQAFLWKPGVGVEVISASFETFETEAFRQSPVRRVIDTCASLRRKLGGENCPSDFDVTRELKAQGATDYLAVPLFFASGGVHGATFATQQPDGFTDAQIAAIESVIAPLARVAENRLLERTASILLDTYVGNNAGTRILAGQIRRGDTATINAAIWLSDMRGFTRLADRLPPQTLVDMLNRYFDCQVPAIVKHGGEVLKFIGDGLLAIFPIASLIGHSGSSAFRPTTTTAVSMSLTGSCFSSESAPSPSIMGVDDEAEQSTERPCCNERQVQAIGRTHLIHRPARDIIPPQGGARVSSYRM